MENHNYHQHFFRFNKVTNSIVPDIIASLKTSKSGFDNINAYTLKLTSKAVTSPLAELINFCIRTGDIPLTWKSAQVTPVFKSEDLQDKRNYRTISVLSVFDTVF